MSITKTKFRTIKPLTDMNGNRIPEGTYLIFYGNKQGKPLFRNAENGRQHILDWKDMDIARTMAACSQPIIHF